MEPMDMDENLIPKEKRTLEYKWVYAVVGLLAGCLFTFGVSYLCFSLGKDKRINNRNYNEDVFNSTVYLAVQNKLEQQAPQTGRLSDSGVNAIKTKQDELLNMFKEIKNNNSREMQNIKQLVKTETLNSRDEVQRVLSDGMQRLMTKDDSTTLLKLLQKVKNDTQKDSLRQMIANASMESKESLKQLIDTMMKQMALPQDIGTQMMQFISNMTQSQSQQMANSMQGVIEALHSMMNMTMGINTNTGLTVDVMKLQKAVVDVIKNSTNQIMTLIRNTKDELLTGRTVGPVASTTVAPETTTAPIPKHDCLDWYRAGATTSGIYSINLNKTSDYIDVYCDMTTDGGGWLVFQQRTDGSENFDRVWNDYENGFGNKSNEFWLGNKYLNLLTKNTPTEVRIDLKDWNNSTRYAKYASFRIGDAASKYTLFVTGYSGNAGDGLDFHHELKFSTKDQDNEKGKGGCAQSLKGGWWFDFCAHSSLNGEYIVGGSAGHNKGINWQKWKGDNYSMKTASMMLRRKS